MLEGEGQVDLGLGLHLRRKQVLAEKQINAQTGMGVHGHIFLLGLLFARDFDFIFKKPSFFRVFENDTYKRSKVKDKSHKIPNN